MNARAGWWWRFTFLGHERWVWIVSSIFVVIGSVALFVPIDRDWTHDTATAEEASATRVYCNEQMIRRSDFPACMRAAGYRERSSMQRALLFAWRPFEVLGLMAVTGLGISLVMLAAGLVLALPIVALTYLARGRRRR